MLPFPRYSPEGVDPHIQTIRAVWPAKGKGGHVTDKPSDATSALAPETPRCRVDAVIQPKQPSISGRKWGIGTIEGIGA
jgi:hypothetical protein